MKRAVKSFSYNRTVHVIWFIFPLHFRSRVKLLSRIQWPTHGSRHPSNQPLRIHVSATVWSIDSERCFLPFLTFFWYVVNPFSHVGDTLLTVVRIFTFQCAITKVQLLFGTMWLSITLICCSVSTLGHDGLIWKNQYYSQTRSSVPPKNPLMNLIFKSWIRF